MIGKILKNLKNKLDLDFYTKPQKYSVGFQVQVKNLAPQKNQIDVILPFPLESDYQKLVGNYEIIPTSGKLKREAKYQNKYIHWQETLQPNQISIFKINFKILVRPKELPTERIFQSSDYTGLNKNEYKQFLESDKYLNAKDKRVIKISNDLVAKEQDIISKIKILNNYVVKNLSYGSPMEGLYTLDQTLKNNQVDCGGFDVLLGSLCLAQKIPARIVSGFWVGYGSNGMHAWLEILLPNGDWISADPSIEQLSVLGRTKKVARLGFVGSDRIALSRGQNVAIKIGRKVTNLDILQNPKVLASRGKDSVKVNSIFDAKRA